MVNMVLRRAALLQRAKESAVDTSWGWTLSATLRKSCRIRISSWRTATPPALMCSRASFQIVLAAWTSPSRRSLPMSSSHSIALSKNSTVAPSSRQPTKGKSCNLMPKLLKPREKYSRLKWNLASQRALSWSSRNKATSPPDTFTQTWSLNSSNCHMQALSERATI